MNVILFGFKRCGKSYLGSLLAERLEKPFIDTDGEVEKLYFKRKGLQKSCREIYLDFGEPYFRALEEEVVAELFLEHQAVISLGGGTPLSTKNANRIQHIGILIYLKISKESLKERLSTHPLPAFFTGASLDDEFERMYAHRKAVYEAIPAHPIEIDDKNPSHIIEEIIEAVYRT